jgi:hypothetical protein
MDMQQRHIYHLFVRYLTGSTGTARLGEPISTVSPPENLDTCGSTSKDRSMQRT